jgi:hypothetical protein
MNTVRFLSSIVFLSQSEVAGLHVATKQVKNNQQRTGRSGVIRGNGFFDGCVERPDIE